MITGRWAWSIAAALWLTAAVAIAPAQAAPKLKAEKPHLDLGEVTAGTAAVAEFPLANIGDEPIKIEKVVAGCGCMTTSYPETLQPGEKGVLKVTLNAYALWSGTVEKHVTILSNDPDQPSMDMQIGARIRPLFVFTPPNPITVSYHKGETIRQLFTVTPAEGSSVAITGITPGSVMAEAKILPAEPGDKPGTRRIELTGRPPATGGDFMGMVMLETSHPTVKTIPLLINGMSADGITVSPAYLYLSVGTEAKAGPLASVALFKRTGPFRVLEVKSDNPALKAEVNEEGAAIGNGATYRELTVRYLGGLPKGQTNGKIVVTTDDPTASKIEILYQATVN